MADQHFPVPLADPRGETLAQRAEILAAIAEVIDGGRYILGPHVAAFEAAMARTIRTEFAIGVGSGTDALVLAMLGLGVGVGDEVITISHTAGPTVAAIRMIGAVPVLIDVREDTYCLDASKIAAAKSARTRAVLPVHLYGHGADLGAIKAAAGDVPVIEDCAQAQGGAIGEHPIGSMGALACFSFYPTKNLGAVGDGGAVATGDSRLAERVRHLRAYGWKTPQFAELEGGRCSRLDEIQAALLAVKLKRLDAGVERRRQIAALYRAGLEDLPIVLPRECVGYRHAYHLYVIRSDARDALQGHLDANGIGTGRHYPFPVHVQPGLATKARIPEPLAVTEQLAGEILSLPIFGTMTDGQVERVISATRSFYR